MDAKDILPDIIIDDSADDYVETDEESEDEPQKSRPPASEIFAGTVAPTFVDRDPTAAASGVEQLPRLETVGDAGLGKGWKKTAAFTITAATKAATCVVTISHPSPSPIGTIPSGTRILITLIPAAQGIAGILNGKQWYVKPTGSANEFELYGAYNAATGDFTQPADTSAVAALTAPYSGIFHIQNFVQQQVFYIDKDQNNITSVNKCPFVVGERLSLANVSGALLNNTLDLGTISNITMGTGDHAGYVKIAVGTLVFPAATLVDFTTDSVFYSTSCNDATFKPGYTVDEVELVMQQVVMPKGYTGSMMKSMKEKGMMRYDFLSFMNYKHSMVQSDTEATVQLPLQNSRAKAVLMLPLDSTNRSPGARVMNDDSSAFKGILDGIKEYRFNVDQKLNPDRPVPLSLLKSNSIEQQYLIELEKALGQSSIQPTSFRHFSQAFCLGRALALQGGSMDTRGKNVDVQISYESPAVNKLWHMWTAHIKSIIVKQNDVSVQI